MEVARGLEAAAGVQVERDLVGVEGALLRVVVLADVVDDGAPVACLATLAVALHDGGAVAVRARDEHDVLAADAVAQEAREEVGGHEDSSDVAEVQVLVAVGHAAGDDRALGERRAGDFGVCHVGWILRLRVLLRVRKARGQDRPDHVVARPRVVCVDHSSRPSGVGDRAGGVAVGWHGVTCRILFPIMARTKRDAARRRRPRCDARFWARGNAVRRHCLRRCLLHVEEHLVVAGHGPEVVAAEALHVVDDGT